MKNVGSLMRAVCLVGCVLASPLASQTAQPNWIEDDPNIVLGCAIVYARVADMYRDRALDGQNRLGEQRQNAASAEDMAQTQQRLEQDQAFASSFSELSLLYSHSADWMLTQSLGDETASYETLMSRMPMIVNGLNQESERHPEGDLGVIDGWLPYCDSLQPQMLWIARTDGSLVPANPPQ